MSEINVDWGIQPDKLIKMVDVPFEIWNAVYDKWAQAYLDGWDKDKLWNGCGLCKWVMKRGDGCKECPLAGDSWCHNFGAGSRLAIEYFDWTENEDEWRYQIREFLRFLRPYCMGDEYE